MVGNTPSPSDKPGQKLVSLSINGERRRCFSVRRFEFVILVVALLLTACGAKAPEQAVMAAQPPQRVEYPPEIQISDQGDGKVSTAALWFEISPTSMEIAGRALDITPATTTTVPLGTDWESFKTEVSQAETIIVNGASVSITSVIDGGNSLRIILSKP